jgi:hypothetical protein
MQLRIQVLSIRVLFFIIAFFIMIPPLYGIEEKSWEERYLECSEGNCLNGKGTMIYYSSQKYIGEFKEGKWTGLGIMTYPDGRKITGQFLDGKYVGSGQK